jgi:hypothetical protein
MKKFFLVLAAVALSGVACKKETEVPVDPTKPAPSSRGVALPGAPAPEDIPVDVALQHLNTAVRNYYAEKLAMPATVDDLYSAGYVKQRFKAPEGKQFVINAQNRTVEVK